MPKQRHGPKRAKKQKRAKAIARAIKIKEVKMAEKKCHVCATWSDGFIGVEAVYGEDAVFHPWLSVSDEAAEKWAREQLGLSEDVKVDVDIRRDALGYTNP